LRRYAEALLPGFVGLYQANAQSTRSLTGRGDEGGDCGWRDCEHRRGRFRVTIEEIGHESNLSENVAIPDSF
jgi:hypothetical protein